MPSAIPAPPGLVQYALLLLPYNIIYTVTQNITHKPAPQPLHHRALLLRQVRCAGRIKHKSRGGAGVGGGDRRLG